MKIQNALVSNILDRTQRYFAHVTTVTLSWRVQNIVVIGRVYLALECFEFSSNFEFDRNMLSGTGARCLVEINFCVFTGIIAKSCFLLWWQRSAANKWLRPPTPRFNSDITVLCCLTLRDIPCGISLCQYYFLDTGMHSWTDNQILRPW